MKSTCLKLGLGLIQIEKESYNSDPGFENVSPETSYYLNSGTSVHPG